MLKLFVLHPWFSIIAVLWALPWKGVALWRSARRNHIGWFIVLLIVNTLAILDILYIFIFSKMGEKKEEKPDSQPTVPVQQPPMPNSNQKIV
jgi:hypothetical protein